MSAHLERVESKSNSDVKDPEKAVGDAYVVPARQEYKFDAADLDRVQRKLKQRHVQMSVGPVPPHTRADTPQDRRPCRLETARAPLTLPQIAGTIGTGLFLGSGKTLRVAGPLGALIAYGLVGSVAYRSAHIVDYCRAAP